LVTYSLLLKNGNAHSQRVYRSLTLTPEKEDDRANTSIPNGGIGLAIHPSVIKRHRQGIKRRERNVETKSRLRTLIKKARQAIESKDLTTASMQIRAIDKALGKAVSKGIIKHNTASRWLSRLSHSVSRLGAIG
jgi:small subunit ribosomal protein S20